MQARKNLIQNIVIVLLSVSVPLLLMQTPLITQGTPSYLSEIFADNTTLHGAMVEAPTKLSEFPAPVHIAVTGAYGRYGEIDLQTTDEAYTAPGSLLREALGSANNATSSTESKFRAALSDTSVFYDFGTALPVSVIAELSGTETSETSLSARLLLLSANSSGVKLYLTDGQAFYCYNTEVSSSALADLVNSYQLGNAAFAFELDNAKALAPYSLFLTGEMAAFPELSVVPASLDSNDDLLTVLGFNPHTNSRYTESSGTEVIIEGNQTLHLLSDGTVVYENGGDDNGLQISAVQADPTAEEAITGCFRLLSSMLGSKEDAVLCLQHIQVEDGIWTLQFDYQVNGVLIRQSSGVPAAEIVLNGVNITSFSFCVRQYTTTENTSLLLPLTQTLAIAAQYPGRELDLCYTDSGTDTCSVNWLTK